MRLSAEAAMPPPLHVLNTRPAAQAAALSAALRAQGWRVDELPLLTITPRSLTAAERRLLLELDRYSAVFFVSANAVRLGLAAVADYWPQWPHCLPAYVVGAGSASALRDTAITVHQPVRANSEGLLALPDLQAVSGQRFLIFRGEGGRELLLDTLRARGARVDLLILYRRELPPDAAQRWAALSAPQVVILTSPDALRHWQQVAATVATQPVWLVVSPRMRALAEAAGAHVIEADAADTASIIAALNGFLPQHLTQNQGTTE
jgi:uroporphyrinogen-III synthase